MDFSGQIMVAACDPFESAGWMVWIPVLLWCIPVVFFLARVFAGVLRDFGRDYRGASGVWLFLSVMIIFETFMVNKGIAEKGGGGNTNNPPAVVRSPCRIINLYVERDGKLFPIGVEIREAK